MIKINKEVAKAAKKSSEKLFDEAQFRSTNARVLEHQAKTRCTSRTFCKGIE